MEGLLVQLEGKIDWIWEPSPEWVERTNVWRFMQRRGFNDREQFLRWSVEKPEEFWDALMREMSIRWTEDYSQVKDSSRGPEWTRWFLGGKLNIADNCLYRHADRENPAILWENEAGETRSVSFAELRRQTAQLANYLDSIGLKAGDRVALVMPMVPEIVTILYACFERGLIVVPIFAGFGPGAIAARLSDSGARAVFTADYQIRRGKRIPLAEKIPPVEHTIIYRYGNGGWGDLLDGQPDESEMLSLDSETPALLLYTSGTTGRPKGCVHMHAGALAQMAKEIFLAFDHQPEDRFFWLSDIGWMMGPWTILGNHCFGSTIFLYDGAPDYPEPDRLWEMIERHRITTFGVSPTAVRLLMPSTNTDAYAMESLRLLGSTGEPWDDSSYRWFFENVGKRRCPIINICGGTEIVGCFLLPLPIQPLKLSTLGGPSPGMAVDVVDDNGAPLRGGKHGYLVCTAPTPSMTRGIWGDPERYIETYWSRFPGWWWHGDWASVDEDGCWFVHGRADESMNVAGRKIGPAEVEEAAMMHEAVAEAAVIGVPHPVKGEGIVCFAVLKPGYMVAGPETEIARVIESSLGPTFRPELVRVVEALPKTQSGKIVRRLIRAAFLAEPLGDTSTVDNAALLETFRGADTSRLRG